jgi:hypothetical protein
MRKKTRLILLMATLIFAPINNWQSKFVSNLSFPGLISNWENKVAYSDPIGNWKNKVAFTDPIGNWPKI